MIYGILLAAGNSARFGSNKLLQAYDGQYSLAQQSALNLKQAIAQCIVVVRPDAPQLIQQLAAIDMKTVTCPDADAGMSASIACGIRHCADATGWLIALADMPLVQAATIKQLADALELHGIVAPYHQHKRGNPVGFAAGYRERLLGLSGDKGARDLLKLHEADIHRIKTDDRGVLLDIDTPDDFDHYLSPRG